MPQTDPNAYREYQKEYHRKYRKEILALAKRSQAMIADLEFLGFGIPRQYILTHIKNYKTGKFSKEFIFPLDLCMNLNPTLKEKANQEIFILRKFYLFRIPQNAENNKDILNRLIQIGTLCEEIQEICKKEKIEQ